MNPKWLTLAGDLLRLAADEFSNHGEFYTPPPGFRERLAALGLRLADDPQATPTA